MCYQSKCLVVKKCDQNVSFFYLPINPYSKEMTQPVDVFIQAVEICLNQPKKRKDQTHFEKVNWPELSPIEDIKAEYNYRKDLEHIKFGIHRERAWITDHIMVRVIASANIEQKDNVLKAFLTPAQKANYPTATQSFRILGEKGTQVFLRFAETARRADRFITENPCLTVVDVQWDFPQESEVIREGLLSEIVHDNANQQIVKSLSRYLKID